MILNNYFLIFALLVKMQYNLTDMKAWILNANKVDS